MVSIIKFLSTIATAFVLSVIYHTLQLESVIHFIAYLLCLIYVSDRVSMYYVNKYLSRKQAMEMKNKIKLLIEEVEFKDKEDKDE